MAPVRTSPFPYERVGIAAGWGCQARRRRRRQERTDAGVRIRTPELPVLVANQPYDEPAEVE
jgi:hypothetical protein